MTGLAGLTFEAHGGFEVDSRYHEALNRSEHFVVKAQQESGMFGRSMYEHGIATTFLAQRNGKKGETNPRLEKARRILIDSQLVKKAPNARGGWRYSPQSRVSDLSVTAWCLRALFALRAAGYKIPDEAIANGLASANDR